MKSLISLMPYRVDPKKAEGVEGTLVLDFHDTGVSCEGEPAIDFRILLRLSLRLTVRRSVCFSVAPS